MENVKIYEESAIKDSVMFGCEAKDKSKEKRKKIGEDFGKGNVMKRKHMRMMAVILTGILWSQTVSAGIFKEEPTVAPEIPDVESSISFDMAGNARDFEYTAEEADYSSMKVRRSEDFRDEVFYEYGYFAEESPGWESLNGFGMDVYLDGSRREGHYKYGQPHGIYVYTHENGDMFISATDSERTSVTETAVFFEGDSGISVGNYVDGLEDGDFIRAYFGDDESSVTIGKWKFELTSGEVVTEEYSSEKWSEGNNMYFGQKINNRLEGPGMYYSEDDQIYVGMFSDGELNGFGMCMYGSGYYDVGYFEDGVQVGSSVYINKKEGTKTMGYYGRNGYEGVVAHYTGDEMIIVDPEANEIGRISIGDEILENSSEESEDSVLDSVLDRISDDMLDMLPEYIRDNNTESVPEDTSGTDNVKPKSRAVN